MNELKILGRTVKNHFLRDRRRGREEERGYSTDICYHNIILIFYFLERLIIIVILNIQLNCFFKKVTMKVINRSNSVTSFPSYKLLIFYYFFIYWLSIYFSIYSFLFHYKNAYIFLTFFVSLLFRIISKELILPIESN